MVGMDRQAVRRRAARRADMLYEVIETSREFFPEPQSAQAKKQIRHHDEH